MPHINIKHYPGLTDEQKSEISNRIQEVIVSVSHCKPSVVSVVMEPVSADEWHERVIEPELIAKQSFITIKPNY
ncbi:tautomerase family protein [Litoribacillus peritrichatus]|uniref:4-oxalocrotonate tautomerase-like domain-containing protein n=1 Tax=Litoribacillus peritrichatus TaxID=718191 RepID=A0ABP7N0J8_9GAMM